MSVSRVTTAHSARRALVVLAALLLTGVAAPTLARAQAPYWHVTTQATPTHLAPGAKEQQIRVVALNLGDAEAQGPITIVDTLPKGVEAVAAVLREGDQKPQKGNCTVSAQEVSCTWRESEHVGQIPLRVEIPPYGRLEVTIVVNIAPSAEVGQLDNVVRVSGGNAPSVPRAEDPVTIGNAPVPFGVEKYEVRPENEDGSPATQAGGHPFQLTTTLNFNRTITFAVEGGLHPSVPALTRNLKFDMPPGLVARAGAVAQCTTAQFGEETEAGQGKLNACPQGSAIGVASVVFYLAPEGGFQTKEVPVFNLEPRAGEPARFGFEASGVPVYIDTAIRTGENYGAEVIVSNASTVAEVISSEVVIWGVPGAPAHRESRGWECIDHGFYEYLESIDKDEHPCPEAEVSPQAFLTMPTVCSSEESANESTVNGESWPTSEHKNGVKIEHHLLEGEADTYLMPELTGCEGLPFAPSMSLEPGTHSTSTPAGLKVDVNVDQKGLVEASGPAPSTIKETTVALPEGLQANPGAANGLSACSVGAAGFGGSGGLGNQLSEQQFSREAVTCPEQSTIGKVRIVTPLLPNPLTGFVYLGEQDTNPFASPLVLYLVAEDPVSGVRVKLAGEVQIRSNGQLVSVFRKTPAQPFSELELEFFGGGRASQATPAFCGSYHAGASFVPWSGERSVAQEPGFTLESGPNGSGCPGATLPFSPSFLAGSTVNQADAFTPFTLTIGRPDGQQALKSVTMHLPPGLAAMISSVTPCAEPAGGNPEAWACGPESLIGHSTAVSGLGGDPVTLGGSVYFGGPYKGAPFSIVDITPATAGPFHLGNVVVRSTIDVDPNTAAATITSDEIPQFVKGVPSQIKEINVTVDRAGFEFNPTDCGPMAIAGTLAGYEGASEEVSSPFQVSDCAALPFAPDFKASTTSHTSKADGANLFVKIVYPKGSYANVAKSITELPYALPSRLTTIQKACPDTTFEANPASCDEGSTIGEAIVHTPVFKNPLVGPAYLVSHGNRAFPDIEIVLQGEGITLVLDGHTDIKNSITKTSFESVPDAPVEVFELNLPEGPHSALAANDNLCKPEKPGTVTEKVAEKRHGRTIHVTKKVHKLVPEELVIPTKLIAQNGRVLEQKTKISVSGCGGVKGSKSSKKPAKKHKKSGKKKKKK